MKIKEAFYYDTIKLVTVRSVKLGVAFRIIQLIVLLYIGIYALWYKKGYQGVSPVAGALYTKVKGFATVQGDYLVVDAGDLVIPEMENDALFIATRSLTTVQTQNQTCVDATKSGVKCNQTNPCPVGYATDGGITTGACDNSTGGYCFIRGWCPVESDFAPTSNYLGVENFTVYIRTSVEYTLFGKSFNTADKAELGYNIFYVRDMIQGMNETNIESSGGMVSAMIDWTCNLDSEQCLPKYRYSRVDVGALAGFNFRQVTYINPNVSNNTNHGPYSQLFSQRVYTKYWGIRFIFSLVGQGGRFDVFSTIVTVGSGITFFGVATIITDFVLQYFHPRKDTFDHAKRQLLEWNHEAERAALINKSNSTEPVS